MHVFFFFPAASVPLLMASPTQGSVPLLQELHFHNLIDRRSIHQLIYESRHQVLVVAREDAQMVSRLVSQAVLVICVQSYKYGGTTAETSKAFGEAMPFGARLSSHIDKNRSHAHQHQLTWIWDSANSEIQASLLHAPSSCAH